VVANAGRQRGSRAEGIAEIRLRRPRRRHETGDAKNSALRDPNRGRLLRRNAERWRDDLHPC
jgi:hypothetical protein